MSLMAVTLAAGTALAVIGKVREGQVMSFAERYSALVAESQAQAFKTAGEFESESLRKQSEFERRKLEREKQLVLGRQRAAYAKAGVRIEEGSPLEVMSDTAAEFELDLAANRYNTQLGLEKIRYETELGISRSLSEAEYRRRLARQYKLSSYIGAGSTLLTGGYLLGKQLQSNVPAKSKK